MGRRLGMLQDDEKYQIKSPADAANLVMVEFRYRDHDDEPIMQMRARGWELAGIIDCSGLISRGSGPSFVS